MNRWKLGLVGLTLAVSALVGCKQKLYVSEVDDEHYKRLGLQLGGIQNLENDPTAAIVPNRYDVPPPPTMDEPNRQRRDMTLAEAIAIALEQGNTGSQSALFPGIGNDNIQASPRGGTFSDSIKVLALDPAIAGADIEAALSKFDARFTAYLGWNKLDTPQTTTFGTNSDTANAFAGVYKPLPTGGVVGITAGRDQFDSQPFFTHTNFPGGQNPFFTLPTAYRPRVQFAVSQPLLKNYGIEINQLLSNAPIPGGILPGRATNQSRVEGILITRLRADGAKADFEKNVNYMLLNVEFAYWNLYSSYGALDARDEALEDALALFKDIEARVKAGGAGIGDAAPKPQDLERIRAQLQGFRAQRFTTLGDIFEKERQLRSLLGMKYDGTRLVPIDVPKKAPFAPNWQDAINEAMVNRPELTLARQDLKFRQFDLMIARNNLRPELMLDANYDINGIGRRLDGSTNEFTGQFDQNFPPQPIQAPRNALASLASNKFNSWGVGLRFEMPLGFRDAHSQVRAARLNLYRSYASMTDSERKVIDQLRVNYSRLSEYYMTIQAQYAQYIAAKTQHEILVARRINETNVPANLEASLNAQQTKAIALVNYYKAVADYNNAWVGWQFAKGTIMQYDNVVIADGPLPQAAQIRAVDHFRERAKGFIIRERPGDQFHVPGAGPGEPLPLPREMFPANVEPRLGVPGVIKPDLANPIPAMTTSDLPAFGNMPPRLNTTPTSR